MLVVPLPGFHHTKNCASRRTWRRATAQKVRQTQLFFWKAILATKNCTTGLKLLVQVEGIYLYLHIKFGQDMCARTGAVAPQSCAKMRRRIFWLLKVVRIT
jgi:hypothetical protein